MTKSINCVSELDLYLDNGENDLYTVMKFICCRDRKLAIPSLTGAPIEQLSKLHAQGFERTVVFPCGHVFGDRCVKEKCREHKDLACPLCGFQMTYTNCGHTIAPAIVPVSCTGSSCDTFPLTIPEGGRIASNCKECRWATIKAKLRYVLNSECVICAQRASVGLQLQNLTEHDAHRSWHVKHGIKPVLDEIMMLVCPDFITRKSENSVQKAAEERDQRDISAALLHAMALTELENTVWQQTAMTQLTKRQVKTHGAGVGAIEQYILGLLMQSGESCRRMW